MALDSTERRRKKVSQVEPTPEATDEGGCSTQLAPEPPYCPALPLLAELEKELPAASRRSGGVLDQALSAMSDLKPKVVKAKKHLAKVERRWKRSQKTMKNGKHSVWGCPSVVERDRRRLVVVDGDKGTANLQWRGSRGCRVS